MSKSRSIASISITPEQQRQDCYPPIYRFKFHEKYNDGTSLEGYIAEVDDYMRNNDKWIDARSKNEVADILETRQRYLLRELYCPQNNLFNKNDRPGTGHEAKDKHIPNRAVYK